MLGLTGNKAILTMHAELSNRPQQNAVGAASFVCPQLGPVTNQQAGNSRATPVWGQAPNLRHPSLHSDLVTSSAN